MSTMPPRKRYPFLRKKPEPQQQLLFFLGKSLKKEMVIHRYRDGHNGKQRQLIAMWNGNKVATLDYEPRVLKLRWSKVKVIHISRVLVENRAAFGGKGAGPELLKEFIEHIRYVQSRIAKSGKKKKGYYAITTDIDSKNSHAIAIATKLGFRKVGSTNQGAWGQDDVLYHYELAL
ncbi:MAG: hypothetical protein V1776_02320 [Candidatus Diapherotrites archaeon]